VRMDFDNIIDDRSKAEQNSESLLASKITAMLFLFVMLIVWHDKRGRIKAIPIGYPNACARISI